MVFLKFEILGVPTLRILPLNLVTILGPILGTFVVFESPSYLEVHG